MCLEHEATLCRGLRPRLLELLKFVFTLEARGSSTPDKVQAALSHATFFLEKVSAYDRAILTQVMCVGPKGGLRISRQS